MTPTVIPAFATPKQTTPLRDQGFKQVLIKSTDYVLVPGLVSVEEIRLDGQILPEYTDHSVPKDGTHKNFETIRLPNYQVTRDFRGESILQRGLNSNDGKWQPGSILAIKGVWADSNAPVGATEQPASTPQLPDAKTEADPLEGLTVPQLRARAAELGIDPFPPTVGKAVIQEAIRKKLAEG